MGGYRFAWVGFVEAGAEKLVRPVASAGYEKGYLESKRVSWDEATELGRGPTGNAIRSGKPSVVRDLLTDDGYLPWRTEALARGYASTVALPLSANGNSFGSLNIYASEPDAFDAEEVALLMGLAGDLSYGISALRTRGERDEQAVAFRRTGEQLSLLHESLPIIFYTSRAEDDFGVTYVSSNVEMVTGHEPADLISDSSFWIHHIHPEDTPRVFEELPKVFQKGYHEYGYRWRSADGSYKWFLDVLRLVQPEGAEVGHIFKDSGSWGENPPARREFNTDECWSLRQGQPHIFIQGSHGMRCPHVDEETSAEHTELSAGHADGLTYICIPVKATGSIIGCFASSFGSGQSN